jgi:hypothetical protein
MTSSRHLLSNDKFVNATTFNDRRYVHIRRYFLLNGEFTPKKEGVALFSDEWATFRNIINDIETEKGGKTWCLSPRAYVWKKEDETVEFGLASRVWNEETQQYKPTGQPQKTVVLYPSEWQNLLSKAPSIE